MTHKVTQADKDAAKAFFDGWIGTGQATQTLAQAFAKY
jgi:hypothetical protein